MQKNRGGVLMRVLICLLAAVTMAVVSVSTLPAFAASSVSPQEQSMSNTLDLWREGRYEQLFENLAHRGKTSREMFVKKMRDTNVRPACCWQKMENFRILNEKRTESTVYVKLGLEGTAIPMDSCTREFKLTHEEGIWKMQLSDVYSIAEVKAKKTRRSTNKH
jgi:hypothetical protein